MEPSPAPIRWLAFAAALAAAGCQADAPRAAAPPETYRASLASDGKGLLRIRFVMAVTGKPVPAVTCLLFSSTASVEGDPNAEKALAMPHSIDAGDDGRLEATIPADLGVYFVAWSKKLLELHKVQTIGSLKPGEVRELVVELDEAPKPAAPPPAVLPPAVLPPARKD